jgi:plasmid stabilization system protein ParE
VRLRYTPEALAELDEVLTGIGQHSPQGALRVQARIKTMLDLLLDHPHSGQRTNLEGLRRIVVTPYPYLIFYEPSDEEVVIIGIRHSARDPVSMPGYS